MPSHSRTPENVLNAPSRTVVHTFVPQGATRQERRHGVAKPALIDGPIAFAAYVKSLQKPNPTAVRNSPRRGRRVKRCAR